MARRVLLRAVFESFQERPGGFSSGPFLSLFRRI